MNFWTFYSRLFQVNSKAVVCFCGEWLRYELRISPMKYARIILRVIWDSWCVARSVGLKVNHISIDELDKRNPVISSELKSATLESGSANYHSFMRTKSKLLLPEGQNNLTFDWVLMLLAFNEHKELRTSKGFEARNNIYLVISIKTGKVFAVFGSECVKRR